MFEFGIVGRLSFEAYILEFWVCLFWWLQELSKSKSRLLIPLLCSPQVEGSHFLTFSQTRRFGTLESTLSMSGLVQFSSVELLNFFTQNTFYAEVDSFFAVSQDHLHTRFLNLERITPMAHQAKHHQQYSSPTSTYSSYPPTPTNYPPHD